MKSLSALLVSGCIAFPWVLSARMAIAVVPQTDRAAELAGMVEEKLVRTDRYLVLPFPGFSAEQPVCPELPRIDQILSVRIVPETKGRKTKGEIRIFRCRDKTWLTSKAEASSGKIDTLAANLKQDIVRLLPFTETIELSDGSICIAGGDAAAIKDGHRLWWFSDQGSPLGRWIITAEAPADGCVTLVQDYRLYADTKPGKGHFVSDLPASVRPPVAYSTPRLGKLVRGELSLEHDIHGNLNELIHYIGSVPKRHSGWIADVQTSPGEFSLYWSGTPGRSAKEPLRIRSGYHFRVTRSGWNLGLSVPGKNRDTTISSGEIPRAATVPTAVLIVHEGRWSEVYVDGRFVIGLDDESLTGGEIFLLTAKSGKPALSGNIYTASSGDPFQP